MSDWRDVLTDVEADALAMAEFHISIAKSDLRKARAEQRAIMNRAIQRKKYRSHPKKGVDTVAEAH